MERGGVAAGADDRRVAFGFGAAHGVDFDHFRGDLIFVQAGMNHFVGGEVRVEREIDGLLEESDFAGRLDRAHGADLFADIFQLGLRGDAIEEFHDIFFVRVAAIFFFVRQGSCKRRVRLREFFERGAHLRSSNALNAGNRCGPDAGIVRRHAEGVPLFLGRILGGKKKDFRGMSERAALEPDAVADPSRADRMIIAAPSSLWPVR